MIRTLSITQRPGFQLLLLAAVMAAAGFARTAVGPLQEAMRVALILSDNEMALLQGPVIGIPIALTAIPLGLLIDRSSRVRLLLALVSITLVGSLFTAIAPSFPWLLVARFLAGVSALAIVPVVYSLGVDLYPPEQRGRVLTVASIGQVAGAIRALHQRHLVVAQGQCQPHRLLQRTDLGSRKARRRHCRGQQQQLEARSLRYR